mgnify:CR=1 FL=1
MKRFNHISLTWVLCVLMAVFSVTGCSSHRAVPETGTSLNPVERPVEEFVKPDREYPIKEVYDPWEGFNRAMYTFNAGFDKYVFLPALSVYKFILPDPLETCVSNFFNNIDEAFTFVNSLLQLKGEKAAVTFGRFALNSTVGVLGLFDVASHEGLFRQNEDLGQTLGFYGVGQGPYIVLPFLGPSNLRDTTGTVTEAVAFALIDPFNFDQNEEYLFPYSVLQALDTRNQMDFRYYMTSSPFEYETIRLLYDKARKLQIDK